MKNYETKMPRDKSVETVDKSEGNMNYPEPKNAKADRLDKEYRDQYED